MSSPIIIILESAKTTSRIWIDIISVIGAIIVPIIIYILGKKYTSASLELQIREMISAARERSLSSRESGNQDNLDAFIEDTLNAYDEACAKYLNKQVNRKNFRQQYRREITNLIEGKESIKEKIFKENSGFDNIQIVYMKWKEDSRKRM